jgi:hypothetical protein
MLKLDNGSQIIGSQSLTLCIETEKNGRFCLHSKDMSATGDFNQAPGFAGFVTEGLRG